MSYRIRLTDNELDSLGYIGDRYDYARVLYKALEQDDDDGELYHLSEPDAWEFSEAVEQEDGYLPMMGGDLKVKVETLLLNIV